MATMAPGTENDTSEIGQSLMLGTLVWFVHLNLVYNLASLACTWSWLAFTIMGLSGLQLVETIITLIALPLMLFLIYVPWRVWRRFQTKQPPANPDMLEDTEKDWRSLVAFIVMLLNSFYFLFIVSMFVPIFALGPCGQS
jgi:hypothetical protein